MGYSRNPFEVRCGSSVFTHKWIIHMPLRQAIHRDTRGFEKIFIRAFWNFKHPDLLERNSPFCHTLSLGPLGFDF